MVNYEEYGCCLCSSTAAARVHYGEGLGMASLLQFQAERRCCELGGVEAILVGRCSWAGGNREGGPEKREQAEAHVPDRCVHVFPMSEGARTNLPALTGASLSRASKGDDSRCATMATAGERQADAEG